MQSSFKSSEVLGQLELRDYLQIFQRRKWWVILTVIAMTLASGVVIWRLPNIYRSETVILVDPQKVPDNYVASTVTSSVADRLSTLQQEVMSPTRLKRLIDTMGLYLDVRGKIGDQQVVAKMQKAISVEVVTQGGRTLSAFRVSYQGPNPLETAQVANQLAAMFIGENLKSREQQSFGTAEFLDNELQKTKKELEDKEKELGDIKSKYILDLPDSKQYHLEALTTLRSQLRTSQDKVERAQQEKVYLQSLSMSTAPTIDLDSTGTNSSPHQFQIQKLESQLSELRARYGPNHPDIRKLQAQLDDLKHKAAVEAKDTPEEPAPVLPKRTIKNPVIEAQLQKINETIQSESKLQAQVNDQINFHVSKLERVPVFEQRISGLMRDYDSLRAHYASLNDKKLSADMSNNLENRQKGERFVILDPAQVPDRPTAPNRPLLAVAAILGGLIGGCALALLRDLSDVSVRSEREAARILGKPILAGIPAIVNEKERRGKVVRATGALIGTAVASVVLGIALSYITGRLL
jgi:polysaccharide chain length determinant protein (PEP-CTERM system associated)